ncbi:MAG: DUF2208 domain-containing protein [Thermosphaera sp.]
MMSQPPRKTMWIIQALSMVLFALVSAVVPQWAFAFFLVYFIVFMAVMFKLTSRSMKPPPKSELGSPLFKESNPMNAMMYDKYLNAELKKQMSMMMLNFMLLFFVFILWSLYQASIGPFIVEFASQYTENEVVLRFIYFIGMYTFFFGVMQGLRYLLFRGSDMQTFLFARIGFEVYKKGVMVDGRQYVGFTEDLCFVPEPDRKFVELRSIRNKSMKLRLYTLETGRLVDRLKEAGLSECKA